MAPPRPEASTAPKFEGEPIIDRSGLDFVQHGGNTKSAVNTDGMGPAAADATPNDGPSGETSMPTVGEGSGSLDSSVEDLEAVESKVDYGALYDLPLVIEFSDLPEVPEEIRGPSPPIEEDSKDVE